MHQLHSWVRILGLAHMSSTFGFMGARITFSSLGIMLFLICKMSILLAIVHLRHDNKIRHMENSSTGIIQATITHQYPRNRDPNYENLQLHGQTLGHDGDDYTSYQTHYDRNTYKLLKESKFSKFQNVLANSSATSSYLLIFPNQTSKVQIPFFQSIELLTKKKDPLNIQRNHLFIYLVIIKGQLVCKSYNIVLLCSIIHLMLLLRLASNKSSSLDL